MKKFSKLWIKLFNRKIRFHKNYIKKTISRKFLINNPQINKELLLFSGKILSKYDGIIKANRIEKLGEIVYVLKNIKKNNNFLFHFPWFLQKIYNFFFPKKEVIPPEEIEEVWRPFPYKKDIIPDWRWFNPESEPGMTVQGEINFGRRLISQMYSEEDFDPTHYDEALNVVSQALHLNVEVQTTFIMWEVGRRMVRFRIVRW